MCNVLIIDGGGMCVISIIGTCPRHHLLNCYPEMLFLWQVADVSQVTNSSPDANRGVKAAFAFPQLLE